MTTMMVTRMPRLDMLLKEAHRRETRMCDERPTKRARTMSYNGSDVSRLQCQNSSTIMDSLFIEEHRISSPQSIHHPNRSSVRPMKALPQRSVSKPSSTATPTSSVQPPPPPQFSGTFNLISSSSSSIPPNLFNTSDQDSAFRSLYKILSSDNQSSPPGSTEHGQCYLPDRSECSSKPGLIHSSALRDPLNDQRLSINLHDIREVGLGSFSSGLQRKCSDVDMEPSQNQSLAVAVAAPTPGLSAGAQLICYGDGSTGDIIDGFGELAIRRVWCGCSEGEGDDDDDDDTLIEVFEGHLAFQVFFGDSYVQRGLADVLDHRFEFWAVRSRESLSLEAGMREVYA
ncbi:hypothetical protein GYMLUDRAFT_101294 [Collybiopsis luxurians FD-317 M1]|uniref:Uncharacterized protein n=1 Tax=Collybiopsis luxurians FD-317 M1 TaxID=944289 RepID=A0A0D0C6Z6_9AGAR|nr:hypothetical protein GYMLUDRAFT_101294 [Collybiopsis luxurians FD-317 M1]